MSEEKAIDQFDLSELQENLRLALQELEEIRTEQGVLNSRECAAMNIVNQAQKALDHAMSAIRREAPWNTDWQSRRANSA